MPTEMRNLTEEEIDALTAELNLADGHAYRPWSPDESSVIDGLGELFRTTDRRDQATIETAYVQTFLKAAGQSYRPQHFTHFMCFTASMGLEAIANFLRLRRLSVALIEPCFDNLHDILVRHKVPLSVISESLLQARPDEVTARLQAVHSDALMLVSPNNPTGVQLSWPALQAFVEFCRVNRRILILDATFRFFLPASKVRDQYALLADSGIDCMLIEDTGKTWPTLEIKAPFFSVSPRLAPDLAHIYSDFVLHVSPLALKLLQGFIALGTDHVHAVVRTNRRALLAAVEGTCVAASAEGYMGVEWLAVTGSMTASDVRDALARAGVRVLTGHQFFWSAPDKGSRFIRVALVRDPAMFARACERIRDVLTAGGITE